VQELAGRYRARPCRQLVGDVRRDEGRGYFCISRFDRPQEKPLRADPERIACHARRCSAGDRSFKRGLERD
jgi:hypothetical protein